MKKYICIFLLFLISCSTNKIMLEGQPLCDHEYQIVDTEKNIKIKFWMLREFKQWEDDEYMIWSQCLDVFDDIYIDKSDSEKLLLTLKVINAKKEDYILVYRINENDVYLYNGNLSLKNFVIDLPFSGRNTFSIILKNKRGDILLELGDFKYTVVKGGEDYFSSKK